MTKLQQRAHVYSTAPPGSRTGDTGALFPNTSGLSSVDSVWDCLCSYISHWAAAWERGIWVSLIIWWIHKLIQGLWARSADARQLLNPPSLETKPDDCVFVALNVRQGWDQFNFCLVHMWWALLFSFQNLKLINRTNQILNWMLQQFTFSLCLLFCICSFLFEEWMMCILENNTVISWAAVL